MQDVIGWFNTIIGWLNAIIGCLNAIIGWLNANSAAIQVALVLALVVCTWWYARNTKRLVELPEKRRREHALLAISGEAGAIDAACRFSESDIQPVKLPTANYDTWYAALPDHLLPKYADAAMSLYAQVRVCNAWYARWCVAPARQTQTEEISEGHTITTTTDLQGDTAAQWKKERDKLRPLLAAVRDAIPADATEKTG